VFTAEALFILSEAAPRLEHGMLGYGMFVYRTQELIVSMLQFICILIAEKNQNNSK